MHGVTCREYSKAVRQSDAGIVNEFHLRTLNPQSRCPILVSQFRLYADIERHGRVQADFRDPLTL